MINRRAEESVLTERILRRKVNLAKCLRSIRADRLGTKEHEHCHEASKRYHICV